MFQTKRINNKKIINPFYRKFGILCTILFLITGCDSGGIIAPIKKKIALASFVEKPPVKQEEPLLQEEDFTKYERLYAYSSNARRDIFKNLLVKKKVMKEIKERVLTPLEKYDISEFRLVGTIWGQFGSRGVLQVADGKVFNTRVGERIGKNGGFIKRIKQGTLTIEETRHDISEKEIRKEIVLMIRTDEGEE